LSVRELERAMIYAMSYAKTKRVLMLLVGACLGLVSCTTAAPPKTATAEPSRCALGVPGAAVTVTDVEGGVALDLTAPPEALPDLRERASDAAAMHGPGERMGKGHEGKHGSGGNHGLKAMQLPPAHGIERDIPGGARIELHPADDKDLAALRAKVRERAGEMMASCD
jgi:hypothetical protein